MAWTVIGFGKYQGKTLPQIVLTDPDWFFWAIENNIFKSVTLRAEAEEIRRKATRIAIPVTNPSELKVEYTIHPGVGKLADVSVVPVRRPAHEGASSTYRTDHFDLSMPRKIAPYDKTGGKIILDAIKHHVFGNRNARLTRARCEAFFEDDSNFA